MKLRMHPLSYNGGPLARDEFAFTTQRGGTGFQPDGIDGIRFYCPNKNRICGIKLTLGSQTIEANGDPVWHWDGNMAAPTITPSIGCDARCGWHGNIINGDISPAPEQL